MERIRGDFYGRPVIVEEYCRHFHFDEILEWERKKVPAPSQGADLQGGDLINEDDSVF